MVIVRVVGTKVTLLLVTIPVICIPYRNHERWAWIVLPIMWVVSWGGNIVLEARADQTVWIVYSIIALAFVASSLAMTYRDTFRATPTDG